MPLFSFIGRSGHDFGRLSNGVSRHSSTYHPNTNKQALPCCTCISMLSPLQRLSPQRMITKFYRAVTGPMPVLIVPSGRPFLPLSFCIISLYREFFACGWTRGLKRFISIYFCSFYGVLWSVTLPLQLD